MSKVLLKLLICLIGTGITLYAAVNGQNALMALRRTIPPVAKKVKTLQEENNRLEYVVDRFENPIHLLQLHQQPEYKHLKYPYIKDIVILEAPPTEPP